MSGHHELRTWLSLDDEVLLVYDRSTGHSYIPIQASSLPERELGEVSHHIGISHRRRDRDEGTI